MTRGGRICFFSSLRSSRLAACLLRRRWTRTSSTTPAWSTARQSQCFTPAILSTTSSRCHLSPTRGRRRHPSYLGLLVNSLGWALAFRSGVGMLLTALLIPPLVARIRAEERLLRTQFGKEY